MVKSQQVHEIVKIDTGFKVGDIVTIKNINSNRYKIVSISRELVCYKAVDEYFRFYPNDWAECRHYSDFTKVPITSMAKALYEST